MNPVANNRGAMAAIFPGQGSQKVGMGKELYDASPAAKAVLDRAEQTLPGLLDLMWSGPEEELRLTVNQQPALVAAGVAAYAAYLEAGGKKASVGAGHSLGEYTALVAAGSLNLEDALRLVRARGSYMQEAVGPGEGAMVAVLKLAAPEVERVARELSASTGTSGSSLERVAGSSRPPDVVEVANYNAPGQTVLSGSREAIDAASSKLKELGGRVVPLKVSAPFHCSLMQPAADRLAADLSRVAFERPSFPIVCNVTAEPLEDPSTAPSLLEAQVTSSVRWVECVQRLAALASEPDHSLDAGAQLGSQAPEPVHFIEFGAGEVLVNLVRRILPAGTDTAAAWAAPVYDVATLEEAIK